MCIREVYHKVMEILSNPQRFFRRAKKEAGFRPVLIYFLVITLFYIAISVPSNLIQINSMLPEAAGLFGMSSILIGIGGSIFYIIITFFSSFITLFLFAGILHLSTMLMQTRKDFKATLQAYAYAHTPMLIFGAIISYLVISEVTAIFSLVPMVVLALWTIILTIMGIKELHNFSYGRSLLAFIVGIGITIAIFLAIFLFLLLVGLAMAPSFG
ncbi:MAG: YIP1 family protein [Nanoarchaeota archaeon]|nr:YIP1 family protein [Nanoarchaeota archaeon]